MVTSYGPIAASADPEASTRCRRNPRKLFSLRNSILDVEQPVNATHSLPSGPFRRLASAHLLDSTSHRDIPPSVHSGDLSDTSSSRTRGSTGPAYPISLRPPLTLMSVWEPLAL
ncbi:hypothetical protein HETIRDRAFT_101156 [Heterobasidion irregulare TC 32-1]|uniref:Uncharacterized protein n=1 Tax=Heterobasidion irregulare (strain TC 32-1) TaxID=747525 RepID=W4KGT5_HETIT|nr:uncharacterized protein HETIRDRAFT_101156 [Heterobasidion irregulare TC 32-1]ETW85068.1 hypothetical protein HETIRDRAFT_101156 [Heterobasidion irregulare TC 32-1]